MTSSSPRRSARHARISARLTREPAQVLVHEYLFAPSRFEASALAAGSWSAALTQPYPILAISQLLHHGGLRYSP
jgi:hypothetical protein